MNLEETGDHHLLGTCCLSDSVRTVSVNILTELRSLNVCLWVCAHVCMFMWVHGPEDNLWCCSSDIVCLIFIMGLSMAKNSPNRQSWLANEAQESACLCSTGITMCTTMPTFFFFFKWLLGDWTQIFIHIRTAAISWVNDCPSLPGLFLKKWCDCTKTPCLTSSLDWRILCKSIQQTFIYWAASDSELERRKTKVNLLSGRVQCGDIAGSDIQQTLNKYSFPGGIMDEGMLWLSYRGNSIRKPNIKIYERKCMEAPRSHIKQGY